MVKTLCTKAADLHCPGERTWVPAATESIHDPLAWRRYRTYLAWCLAREALPPADPEGRPSAAASIVCEKLPDLRPAPLHRCCLEPIEMEICVRDGLLIIVNDRLTELAFF